MVSNVNISNLPRYESSPIKDYISNFLLFKRNFMPQNINKPKTKIMTGIVMIIMTDILESLSWLEHYGNTSNPSIDNELESEWTLFISICPSINSITAILIGLDKISF